MAVLSSLAVSNIAKANLIRSALASSKNGLSPKNLNYVSVRNGGHGKSMLITPSQFRFMKIRDVAHLYIMLGAIPLGAIVLYCNLFIGPAKLAAIPEGYQPKHWEYFEHPITRWIAWLLPSPQESYEKHLHKIYVTGQLYEIKKLEKKIEASILEREDYQAWYYVNSGAKYTRKAHQMGEELKKTEGKVMGSVL